MCTYCGVMEVGCVPIVVQWKLDVYLLWCNGSWMCTYCGAMEVGCVPAVV